MNSANFKWPQRDELIEFAKWAPIVAITFTTIYGSTNWISAQRETLYKMYFDWELLIPFIPAWIIPYHSINILNLVPLFVLKKIISAHSAKP